MSESNEPGITAALEIWVRSRNHYDFETLLWLLERHPGARQGRSEAQVEREICQAWLTIYDKAVDEIAFPERYASILSNILVGDRWRWFIDSDERAYGFAIMTLLYLRIFEEAMATNPRKVTQDMYVKRAFIGDQMTKSFRQWLPPSSTSESINPRVIGTAFFGSAWCSLAVEFSREQGLAEFITDNPPAFLPGWRSTEKQVVAEVLPELD